LVPLPDVGGRESCGSAQWSTRPDSE
jgi:hypothetical protein